MKRKRVSHILKKFLIKLIFIVPLSLTKRLKHTASILPARNKSLRMDFFQK
ncbi:Uncharacterised protein [Porphyromonas macacae]|uniref:Uncharacterized protein n=1 Tax=Porphyromonas macacae TaxID=28115 RepID=A0A379DIP7_9PORP|nr:Uncharacterised protein [Porphyromonas macacae]